MLYCLVALLRMILKQYWRFVNLHEILCIKYYATMVSMGHYPFNFQLYCSKCTVITPKNIHSGTI